ncbi:hypothetical protein CFP56_033283 [Quercus suber]|uniref:Uncharacterized protein n=1 Tax=Quercus suber TaxID=58331 RepID=A0AAW0MDB0_QUESU
MCPKETAPSERGRGPRISKFGCQWRNKAEHQAYQDVELGGVAKEARERLDERLKLRPQRKSHNKRDNSISKGCLRCVEELQRDGELYGSKKSGSKLLNWAKFSWNVSVEGKCAVCM